VVAGDERHDHAFTVRVDLVEARDVRDDGRVERARRILHRLLEHRRVERVVVDDVRELVAEDRGERVVVRVDRAVRELLLHQVDEAARHVDVAVGERERVDHAGRHERHLELLLEAVRVGDAMDDVLDDRLLRRALVDAAELLLDQRDHALVALAREHVVTLAADHTHLDLGVRRRDLGQLDESLVGVGAVRIRVDRGDEVLDRRVGLAVELVDDAELDIGDGVVAVELQRLLERGARAGVVVDLASMRAVSTHASGNVGASAYSASAFLLS